MQRITEAQNKLHANIVAEKVIVEQKLMELRKDIDHECDVRAKMYLLLIDICILIFNFCSADSIKERFAQEIIELRAETKREVAVREAASEEVILAVNHYSAALQDGIKIVAST